MGFPTINRASIRTLSNLALTDFGTTKPKNGHSALYVAKRYAVSC
jgi:hypothetical protein